jgi:hypothetical protein
MSITTCYLQKTDNRSVKRSNVANEPVEATIFEPSEAIGE